MDGFDLVHSIIKKLGDGVGGVCILMADEGIEVSESAVGMWQSRGIIPRRGKAQPDGSHPAYRTLLLKIAGDRGIKLTDDEVAYLRSMKKNPGVNDDVDNGGDDAGN